MGKIRVKTLGIEELEKEQAKDAKKRKVAKQAKKLAKGAHGGERVVSMAPTEEELEKIEVPRGEEVPQVPQGELTEKPRVTRGTRPARQRSKRYQNALIQIDKTKRYPVANAVALMKKLGKGGFDQTVELHINTVEKGLSGQVMLPHGSGKNVTVTIADVSSIDSLLAKIESGTLDFDILIATPAVMPKLAKVAKILGPRGLMPNPKAGTISDKPEVLAKKFAAGSLNFRTESQAPIIHATIGKVSFAEKDLEENISAFLRTVDPSKIQSATLKSTMSPGIKLDFSTL